VRLRIGVRVKVMVEITILNPPYNSMSNRTLTPTLPITGKTSPDADIELVTAKETITTLQSIIEGMEEEASREAQADAEEQLKLTTANETILALQTIIEGMGGDANHATSLAEIQLATANETIITLQVRVRTRIRIRLRGRILPKPSTITLKP
jgi:hypothetical protein